MTCSSCNGDFDLLSEAHSTSILGYSKDGYPIHSVAAEGSNPINTLAKVTFIASGLALGILLTSTTIDYFKK